MIQALDPNVVTLIKDLNGNHVIQKCLHRLSAEHKQFVYDAVSENCIQVATHRHGCCVLQRCIDYASDDQKVKDSDNAAPFQDNGLLIPVSLSTEPTCQSNYMACVAFGARSIRQLCCSIRA